MKTDAYIEYSIQRVLMEMQLAPAQHISTHFLLKGVPVNVIEEHAERLVEERQLMHYWSGENYCYSLSPFNGFHR